MQRAIDNRYLAFALRLALGGILVTAAIGKLAYPAGEADITAVYAGIFMWMPIRLMDAYILILPWLEIVIGCCLILGLFPRIFSGICIPVVLSFIGANAVWYYTALHPSGCGCFGEMLTLPYQNALIIDAVMLIMAIVILISRSTSWRMDLWFSARRKRKAEI